MTTLPPDQFVRMQLIMADSAVNSIIEAVTNGGVATRESFEMAIRAALTVDPLTHYVRGLDSWQDYLQQRSKHFPVRGRQ